MPQTPRLKVPYPQATDPAVVPADMKKLAESLDGAATIRVGITGGRPPAGLPGALFYATDSAVMWVDDGVAWRQARGAHAETHAWNGTDPLPPRPYAVAAIGRQDAPSGTAVRPGLYTAVSDTYSMVSPYPDVGIGFPVAGVWMMSSIVSWHGEGRLRFTAPFGNVAPSPVEVSLPLGGSESAPVSQAMSFVVVVSGAPRSASVSPPLITGSGVNGVAVHGLTVTAVSLGA